MSATEQRKLSDVDGKLTDGDYDKIGQEIGKLEPAKQMVRLHFRFSALNKLLGPNFVHKPITKSRLKCKVKKGFT